MTSTRFPLDRLKTPFSSWPFSTLWNQVGIEVTEVTGFPAIGTIKGPAIALINSSALIAYEIAPAGADGCALLQFDGVIELSQLPLNSDGIYRNNSGPYVPEFNIELYAINEIRNDEKSKHWKTLRARRWQISFHDETIDIIFKSVKLLTVDKSRDDPNNFLRENIGKLC